MPKNTWLENSNESIHTINELDRGIRLAKQKYQNAVKAGVGDSIIAGFYQVLQNKIKYREGFVEAFRIFSR